MGTSESLLDPDEPDELAEEANDALCSATAIFIHLSISTFSSLMSHSLAATCFCSFFTLRWITRTLTMAAKSPATAKKTERCVC